MTPRAFTESVVEDAVLAWLEARGWQVKHGTLIAPLQVVREEVGPRSRVPSEADSTCSTQGFE